MLPDETHPRAASNPPNQPPATPTTPPPPASSIPRRALLRRSAWAFLRAPFDELPPPPTGGWARLCLALTTLLALAFTLYFTTYMFARHDAYLTSAEDLGIMDQALWNTVHGAILHQTICNPIGDTNCLGDISRLAIHIEPIMFPIALLYLLAPTPKTLILLQAITVAAGAFPAHWLASRRLRSPLAGVAFAATYLLVPALQSAVTFDFHAVTLSAAFLMFALYFLVSRNTTGLIICCLLALSTKEEIPLDIAMLGLAAAIAQRRWRLGAGLIAASLLWLIIAFSLMHAFSPLGVSPTAGRFDYLKHTSPLTILRQHIIDPGGRYYLQTLLSPFAYLPLLSPLAAALALPAFMLNLLSANQSMRSGLYQYNAEIIPILVFSSVASVAMLARLLPWLTRQLTPYLPLSMSSSAPILRQPRLAALLRHSPRPPLARLPLARLVIIASTLLTLLFTLRAQSHGALPITRNFAWPQTTAHTRLAAQLIAQIPTTASVSAQANLVPHLSHRRLIYQYPDHATSADYVLLDVTSNVYPFGDQPQSYFENVTALLTARTDHLIAANDGYILLAHGPGPSLNPHDQYGLPASFYSFMQPPTGAAPAHPIEARFGAALELLGYDASPASPYANSYIIITTYWRILASPPPHTTLTLTELPPHSAPEPQPTFIGAQFRPLDAWPTSATFMDRTISLYLSGETLGQTRFALAVTTNSPTTAASNLTPTLLTQPTPGAAAPAISPDGQSLIFAALHIR